MNINDAKKITIELINTFNKAGEISLDLRKKGLKKEQTQNQQIQS